MTVKCQDTYRTVRADEVTSSASACAVDADAAASDASDVNVRPIGS